MIASEESLPGCGCREVFAGRGGPGQVHESGGVVSHPPIRPPAGAGAMTMYSGGPGCSVSCYQLTSEAHNFYSSTKSLVKE